MMAADMVRTMAREETYSSYIYKKTAASNDKKKRTES